jgi:hypothetical protein
LKFILFVFIFFGYLYSFEGLIAKPEKKKEYVDINSTQKDPYAVWNLEQDIKCNCLKKLE